MNTPLHSPRPVDRQAWDEAFRRVESYLRAHGIDSRVQLNSLTAEIIDSARAAAARQPGAEPVMVAMQTVNARLLAWFERIFGANEADDDRFHARGRLALIAAEVPARWPQYFLSRSALPGELIDAMQAGQMPTSPEVRFTNMAPAPIEYAAQAREAGASGGCSRGPVLRAAAMWLLIIGILGVTWAASH